MRFHVFPGRVGPVIGDQVPSRSNSRTWKRASLGLGTGSAAPELLELHWLPMGTNLDRYKSDIAALLKVGQDFLHDIDLQRSDIQTRLGKARQKEWRSKVPPRWTAILQRWHSEGRALISQVLPVRLSEFVEIYEGPKSANRKWGPDTHSIRDWLLGMRLKGLDLPGD